MFKRLLPLVIVAGGLGLSACATAYPPPPGPGHHVRWCLNHHRDYDPRTNLWADHFGQVHPCEHP